MLLGVRQQTHSAVARKSAILVLGMHRSGTSALSRIVNLLGASAPANPMPPDPANPRGYWESWSIHLLLDELLKSAGSSWHDWRAINPDWLTTDVADQFREKLKNTLQSEYGESPFIVVKDPRLCRILKFWLELLEDLQ